MQVSYINDVSILHLDGEIMPSDMEGIEQTLFELRQHQHNKILIDMSSVEHVHYRVLPRLAAHALSVREEQGDIRVASLQGDSESVFRLMQGDRYMQEYEALTEDVLRVTGPDSDEAYAC